LNTRQKIAALRALMKKNRIQAYYVPSADPHQSEYLPACWQRRQWLSGFTGSAGDLVVTTRKAALWTDGRYWLQATDELARSGITLMKLGRSGTPDLADWTARQLRPGQHLGVDPRVLSVAEAERFAEVFEELGVGIRYPRYNLVDRLWADRPERSLAPIKLHGVRYAGESTADKLSRLRAAMKEHGARAHVLCALDAIAWLFNLRSLDIEYTPVAIAYAVVTERAATIFTDPRKVGPAVVRGLKRQARFAPYDAVAPALQALGKRKTSVLIDPATTNAWVTDRLRGAEIVQAPSPVFLLKAVKNPTQISHIQAAHVRDGVAMVKFLRWLERTVPGGEVTEMSAARKLEEFRQEDKTCLDFSFETISGYRGNGAIIHYAVSAESDTRLTPRGLYLTDSGGQYPEGTTDITRTVTLGKPSRREKEMFTRVLQGLIDCTTTPFPAGTTGQRHELFARGPLWRARSNYNHGTGHGVGQYLGVHEGPCSLKDIPTVPLEPGMLLSIEPGHYEAGKFGIRTENLALVVDDKKLGSDGQPWYRFETVTLCPIDRKLVDRKLLRPEQRQWLNAYHRSVYRELSRHLDPEHRAWLKKATRPI